MKFKFQHGIVLALVSFAVYILSMVFASFGERFPLVAEDYYQQEIRYADQIEKKKNTSNLSEPIRFKSENGGKRIILEFPQELRAISGRIHLYRPSDERLDLMLPLQINDSNTMVLEQPNITLGRWVIKLDFSAEGKPYYDEFDHLVK